MTLWGVKKFDRTLRPRTRVDRVKEGQNVDFPGAPEKVGPYRIERRIGVGGMGAVYRAYDQRLERTVAIKQVHPDTAEDPRARDRLRREARAVASLNHPSIVQIFDIVEMEDGDWIVMELVDGETVHQMVAQGKLGLLQALHLGREIAEGLAEAHTKGIVHRDLKTENVMVTTAGRAKILDFGLAKKIWKGHGEGSISVQGAILGTGRAMSPEQAMGEEVDHRSDLFSLGSLLYEVLTGKPPFLGTSIFHTLAQVCSERQQPAMEINPQIPAKLSQLVDDLLEKSPKKRPQSAADVTRRLIDISIALPPDSSSVYLPSRVRRPSVTLTSVVPSEEEETRDAEQTPTQVVSVRPGSVSDGKRWTSSHIDATSGFFIKSLVATLLVDRDTLGQRLGEAESYELLSRHDRFARDLLVRLDGLEIEKSEGFLFLFERPVDAVRYALEYQLELLQLRAELGIEIEAKTAIHVGEVLLRENLEQDVTRGAHPLEVEGAAKAVTQRLCRLASSAQILLSQGAYGLARRSLGDTWVDGRNLCWQSHGEYQLDDGDEPLTVYEVGFEDTAPLIRPVGDASSSPAVAVDDVASGKGRLGWGLAALAALLLLVVLMLTRPWGDSGPAVRPTVDGSSEKRTAVAVLGFRNLTQQPEIDWMGTAFAESLGAELAGGEQLRLIPGESVARLQQSIDLPHGTNSLAVDTLQLIRRQLDNDYVVLGTYSTFDRGADTMINLNLTMQSTETGERVDLRRDGGQGDIFELVDQVARELRDKLAVGQLTAAEQQEVQATLTDSPEANRLYHEGLALLRAYEYPRAKDALEKAVAADPSYPLAHAALSRAWHALGYFDRAVESARSAYDNVVGLSQREQLEIKALQRSMEGRWQDVIDTYEELLVAHPDEERYALELAAALNTAGRGQDALEALQSMRLDLETRGGGSRSSRARIELLASEAYYSQLDYEAALEAGRKAAGFAAETKGLLLAEAQRLQGNALMQLGRGEEALAVLDQAARNFNEGNDRASATDVKITRGLLLEVRGQRRQSEALLLEALHEQEQIGNKQAMAAVHNSLSLVYTGLGRLEEARQQIDLAVRLAEDLGNRDIEARYLDTSVWVMLNQGHLAETRDLARRELAAYEAIGSDDGKGWSRYYLGQVAWMAGDLDRSRKEHATALKLADGEEYLVGYVRHGMGEIDVLGGDWAAARKHFETALEHRVSYGELSSEAETRLALGRLAWWEGDPRAAEVQVRRAVKELEQAEVPLQQALALLTLAEILADTGDVPGAMEALAQGRELGAAADNPRVRCAVVLTQARLRPEASGLPQQLRQAQAEARTLGMEPLALEGRLLTAISAHQRGDSNAPQDIASGLEEANRRGWKGLARRAQRWLDSPARLSG